MPSSTTNQIVSTKTVHHILEEISEAFRQNGRIQIYRLFLLLDPTIDQRRHILLLHCVLCVCTSQSLPLSSSKYLEAN